jgi:hypothetical protein
MLRPPSPSVRREKEGMRDLKEKTVRFRDGMGIPRYHPDCPESREGPARTGIPSAAREIGVPGNGGNPLPSTDSARRARGVPSKGSGGNLGGLFPGTDSSPCPSFPVGSPAAYFPPSSPVGRCGGNYPPRWAPVKSLRPRRSYRTPRSAPRPPRSTLSPPVRTGCCTVPRRNRPWPAGPHACPVRRCRLHSSPGSSPRRGWSRVGGR